MSELSHPSSKQPATAERVVTDARAVDSTASGRCLMYALFSDIVASPFDAEPAVARGEVRLSELSLPFEVLSLETPLREWRETSIANLKAEYSGLFEVGSKGPPVPIREDLHRNQPAGVREDIVRFYEFFGYGLSEKFAWAPDHLSVELEFMHFLAYQEAENDKGDALAFQLAQYDFSERHLVVWVSELAEKVIQQQPDSLYGRLISALSEFVVKDFEWQQRTIIPANQ